MVCGAGRSDAGASIARALRLEAKMIRLFALFMAAPANADDKDCRRQLQEMRFTPKEAKRLCDPKNLGRPQ